MNDLEARIFELLKHGFQNTKHALTGNMELSNATSPFTDHQPRSVPDWTQIPPVQVHAPTHE